MEKQLSFARKISFAPLLISIFMGIIVTAIVYSIVPNSPSVWISFGILGFIVESLLIYPRYLADTYGYWKIDEQGIHYYDYSTWKKEVRAIFLPVREKPSKLSFADIKNFSVVDGKSIMNTQYPLGGTLKAPLARKIHYLVIQTNNDEVRLNCAWKTSGIPTTQDDIKRVVELINSKI